MVDWGGLGMPSIACERRSPAPQTKSSVDHCRVCPRSVNSAAAPAPPTHLLLLEVGKVRHAGLLRLLCERLGRERGAGHRGVGSVGVHGKALA